MWCSGCSLPGFGCDRDVGELDLLAAAGAEGVVDLRDLPAAGTLAAQLVALEAVGDRGEQAEEGDEAGDQEPQQERAALELADQSPREPEADGDDDVGHAASR